MSGFDINKVMELLPHRYPFLLIDKVIDTDNKEYLTAIKNVSFNEPFFQGHFPGKPIMPGVLILEAMAQATGLLSFSSLAVDP
jgi:3-hydroxyacyl-[acyl-carrier-protein] dehydratase